MNVPQRKIEFFINGQRLTGTLFLPLVPKRSNPAVLFLHGWLSNESGYAKRAQILSELGYVCIAFNLRGHGTSEGGINTITLLDGVQDAIAAYDFLALQTEVDQENIHVVGTSYSGYLALMLASKRKVKSLVLRAPALYRDEDLSEAKSSVSVNDHYKIEAFTKQNNLSINSLSNFKGKILLVESEKDEEIPPIIIQSILKNVQGKIFERQIVKGADHALTKEVWQEEFRQILKSWFSRQLADKN